MIEIKNLFLKQNDFELNNVSLKIGDQQHAILMGPTGCGKTTLIESICGLRPIDRGKILLEGQDVTGLPPGARQIGYVPQDAALFPTMRVDQQITFGMDVRKIDKKKRFERLNELAEALALTSILRRYPNRLSGGEKQRVALARAICFRPRLLCLDEPLSAVDHQTHQKLTDFLRMIHHSESMTILHITHNLTEASNLGTQTFRLESGSITEIKS